MPARSAPQVALGEAIRQVRSERGLSQEELGHRSGLHRNHIGGIERGDLNPSYLSLVKLAEGLGVRLSELAARAEELTAR